MPTNFHAIVWIDHSQARIFHIGLLGEDEMVLHSQLPTRQLYHKTTTIGSGHAAPDVKFLGQVMDAVRDAAQILIIGPSLAKTEFVKYFRSHETKICDRIVAVKAADHPSDGEIIAHGRQYFGMSPARAGAITR